MVTKSENSRARQNIGLVDRALRVVIGTAMLVGGLVYANMVGAQLVTTSLVMIMVSIYPLMTAIIGTDPLYYLLDIRTCSNAGKNQCGTLPYQIKAMMGKAPEFCESDDDHSLENCHDDPENHPKHANWRVEQDPMLYPDDKAMSDFAKRERKLNL